MYVNEILEYKDEIGGLAWASPQDWMCEPSARKKTGLSVLEHQRRTVANLIELRALTDEVYFAPVVQGFEVSDYLRCLDLYAAAGVDLVREPFVGIGTLCRRQGTAEACEIVRAVTDAGLRVHTYGMKKRGLRNLSERLSSADSMAWSFHARRKQRPIFDTCTHSNCANCLRWALSWREEILREVS